MFTTAAVDLSGDTLNPPKCILSSPPFPLNYFTRYKLLDFAPSICMYFFLVLTPKAAKESEHGSCIYDKKVSPLPPSGCIYLSLSSGRRVMPLS